MIEVDPNIKQQQGYREEIPTTGKALLTKVKELIHEGNVRRIIIKHEGRTILVIPLTVGVVVTFLAPALAAIGAIIALIAQCSIEVVRSEERTERSSR
jgi:Domain of unknown function (DUF4342)